MLSNEEKREIKLLISCIIIINTDGWELQRDGMETGSFQGFFTSEPLSASRLFIFSKQKRELKINLSHLMFYFFFNCWGIKTAIKVSFMDFQKFSIEFKTFPQNSNPNSTSNQQISCALTFR